MKLKGKAIPGYPVYEYFLILSLPAPIQTEVLSLREEFHHNYDTFHQIKGRPSLALSLFLQYETMEERIVHFFHRVASSFGPMEVELKNFGSFPQHSIFVSVSHGSPAYDVAKEIRTGAKGLLHINNETKPMIMGHPHVGIVRKLKPEIFTAAWENYKDKPYHNKFVASEMILLRRPSHESPWQMVNKFAFDNSAIPTQQGKLF